MATVTIDPGMSVHACVWFAIHSKFFPYECHQYVQCPAIYLEDQEKQREKEWEEARDKKTCSK